MSSDFFVSGGWTHISQLRFFGTTHPLITLTARKYWLEEIRGDDTMYVSYYPTDEADSLQPWILGDLDAYKGKWVNVFMRTHQSNDNGFFQLILRDHVTGNILSSLFKENIDMWRQDGRLGQKASWGIYRSFNGQEELKDEELLFGHFCIAKGSGRCVEN